MKIAILLALALLPASAILAAGTLDIYVVDTEGGKAMILRTPGGETMLVDAGYPRPDDRDTERIVVAARAAGIDRFDYIVATHYDSDHSGNVARIDARIPGRVFVDHGNPAPAFGEKYRAANYDSYVKAIGGRKRMSVRPGDVIPVQGLRITVVTAGGQTITAPLPGAGQVNTLAPATPPAAGEVDENAASIGLLYEFGKFRMLDLADLLSPIEYRLVCPVNLVGKVDLYMVSHHGLPVSNAAFLVHAVRPRVAIMNNGARKGGSPEVLEILRRSPGLADLWQLHRSLAAGVQNAPEEFIANLQETCEAKAIHVTVRRDGTFTVTNMRNNVSRTYRP